MRQTQTFIFSTVAVILTHQIFFASSTAINSVPAKQKYENAIPDNGKMPFISGSEYLDPEEKYLLAWNISSEEGVIYFEVTAETKGYVGFGISPNGGMTGADILIAGVNEDGTMYSSDRHGVGNQEPVEDNLANWNVTYGEETETHTKLRFHRLLNTCDQDDFQITDATMRIIWALGATDNIAYHDTNRGTKSVNFFLNGSDEDFEEEKYDTLDITVTMKMPAQHTAYWCTLHKAPIFTEKQHIIAIEPVLDNLPALQHTHHFVLFRCIAPDDKDPDEIFGPWVDHEGDFCYESRNSSFPFEEYCNGNIVYVWSKGGKRLVFPPEIGLPMPDKLGQREYFALEIHYDNPDVHDNLEFKTGGRFFYTTDLRQEEAAILSISQEVQPQLTIPPKASDFLVVGHCSGECTEHFLPEEGVTIFNNLFHAHLAGRKLKLRHFRGEEELPWVDVDDYYDFDFQQNKPLTNYRKVERGDQLTVECTYDSTKVKNGGAVIGGLGTQEEMCQAIVYYYPRLEFFQCGSGQDLDEHFNLLGMTKYEMKGTGVAGAIPEFDILEPENLAGDYLESVSFKVNWTQEFREVFQREKVFGEQICQCIGGTQVFEGKVNYPENLKTYIPPDDCKKCEDCSGSGSVVYSCFLLVVVLLLGMLNAN